MRGTHANPYGNANREPVCQPKRSADSQPKRSADNKPDRNAVDRAKRKPERTHCFTDGCPHFR